MSTEDQVQRLRDRVRELEAAVRYMAGHMLWANPNLTGDSAQTERAECIARGFPLEDITFPTGARPPTPQPRGAPMSQSVRASASERSSTDG